MINSKRRLFLLFAFLFLAFAGSSGLNGQTVTKPIDPIPMDTPCTGGSEVSASECARYGVACLLGQKCYRAARNSWSGGVESFGVCYHCEGDPEPFKPVCLEKEVDSSNCGLCLIGAKCYQTSDCSYQCRGGGGIEMLNCSVGDKQYRPDPNNECGTQTRNCCDNGIRLPSWGEWGKACAATCKASDKPTCSLANGTCSYSCTCEEGSWVNCRMLRSCNAGYDTINMSNGNICCQKSDGSGPRCAIIGELDYGWVFQTGTYSCNSAGFPTSSGPNEVCGTCTKGTANWECPIRPIGSSGDWDCKLYICQFGGSVKPSY